MNKIVFWSSIGMIILIESVITTIPLAIAFFLACYICKKESFILAGAFIAGLLLDVLSLRMLGVSSLFFMFIFSMIMLYEKKFEVKTMSFILLSSFIASMLFLLLFGGSQMILQAGVSAFLSLGFFLLLQIVSPTVDEANEGRFV